MIDRRPNLQNIPVSYAEGRRIREAFIRRGFVPADDAAAARAMSITDFFGKMHAWRQSEAEPRLADECPACHADLTGQEIPSDQRHLFGATHFSRRIGVYDRERDRTTHWRCPDCGHQWDRT